MAVLGVCIYGLVLAVVTLTALFTRGWTKPVIIGLIILWIPFVAFGILIVLSIGSLQGGSIMGMLMGWLILAGPIFLFIGIILIIMKVMNRWRG